jgi:hypothetical protein
MVLGVCAITLAQLVYEHPRNRMILPIGSAQDYKDFWASAQLLLEETLILWASDY